MAGPSVKSNVAATVRKDFEKWWEPEYVERLMDGLRKAGLEIESEQTPAAAKPKTETAG